MAAPTDFIRGISAGKLDSFRLHFVSGNDESGPVINDYFSLIIYCIVHLVCKNLGQYIKENLILMLI